MNLPSTEMENLGNIIRAIIFWLDKNPFLPSYCNLFFKYSFQRESTTTAALKSQ